MQESNNNNKEEKGSEERKVSPRARELGRKFYEELKKQGPTLDRVGKTFVRGTKKKP